MINRKVAPPIKDAIDFDFQLLPCHAQILSNNIPLYWLSAGSQEVVQVDWVFEAGMWQEPQTAIAQATAALLKNGTDAQTSLQINEALEFYGASLKVAVNNDYAFVTLHTLTKHLAHILPIVRSVIMDASFPEEELEVYKQNALQRLSVNLRQCDFVANRHIDAFLFGRQHPYGRFTEPDDILALNVEALRAFHKARYAAQNCKIFMAGNINEHDVQLIAQYFGTNDWNGTEITTSISHIATPAEQLKHRMLNDEQGVQGAIRLARNFVTRQHPDFAPMIVVNTLFGGYFGSRLMANIREEKGYTYGIYSHLYNYKQQGALLIATEAGRDVCEAAVDEVFKEMKILREQPVQEDELLLVKNYLLGNLLGDLDGPFSIMQRWKNLILNDMPVEHFHNNISIYKAISVAQVQELANRYYREEDFYNLIVV